MYIEKNKSTSGHGDALKALGYGVVDDGEKFVITATPFEGEFRFNAANVQQLIADKKLLTYKTKIQVETISPEGEKIIKEYSSIPACGVLASASKSEAVKAKLTELGIANVNLSCLIAKVDFESTKKGIQIEF